MAASVSPLESEQGKYVWRVKIEGSGDREGENGGRESGVVRRKRE